MHHNGEEQADGADDSHPPVGAGGKAVILVRKVNHCEGPSDEHSDKQPGGVYPYLKSKQLEERDSVFEHLSNPHRFCGAFH